MADDTRRKGFLLFRVSVGVSIPAKLLLNYKRGFAAFIQSGVGFVVRPKGLCHIIDGGSDCALHQGSLRASGEACLAHRLGEGGEDEVSGPRLVEG